MSADATPFAWNYIHQGSTAFIRDRTLHKLRDRDGYHVTAECGAEFRAESHQFADDLDDVRDRHKCGRCFA